VDLAPAPPAESFCPSCGAARTPGARYCSTCGTDLNESSRVRSRRRRARHNLSGGAAEVVGLVLVVLFAFLLFGLIAVAFAFLIWGIVVLARFLLRRRRRPAPRHVDRVFR
jgi:hypothetical protein